MTSIIHIPKRIILASASPRRKELLKQLGITFDIIPSEAEERLSEQSHWDPRLYDVSGDIEVPGQYVCQLALAKAQDVATRQTEDCLVIGADTIVLKDSILGKPKDEADARRMLSDLQGGWHRVITGVALIDSSLDYKASAYECTEVEVASLTAGQIDWYISSGEYADKAGGYGIQGRAGAFIPGIRGCYFNVVGLPVHLVWTMLSSYKSLFQDFDSLVIKRQ